MHPEYNVLLDPALEITAADLAATWSDIPACNEAGTCTAGKGGKTRFTVDLGDAATLALITFVSTLAKDLAMELVKQALVRARERRAKKNTGEIAINYLPDPATGLPNRAE